MQKGKGAGGADAVFYEDTGSGGVAGSFENAGAFRRKKAGIYAADRYIGEPYYMADTEPAHSFSARCTQTEAKGGIRFGGWIP